jgi:hypothetical protein
MQGSKERERERRATHHDIVSARPPSPPRSKNGHRVRITRRELEESYDKERERERAERNPAQVFRV